MARDELRPLNILFCTYGYYPDVVGGAERQARLQAEELVRRGHRVTVVCARAAGAGSGELGGVQVIRLWRVDRQPFTRISYFVRLGAWLLHQLRSYDLVHVHLANLQADVAVLAARPWGKPSYVKVACGGAVGEIVRLAPVAWLTRWYGFRHATRVQALSTEIVGELAGIGVRQERIIEIPNGIDVDDFAPVDDLRRHELRAKLDLPQDATIVLFVGRLVYYKGIDDLLSAWQPITGQDVRLVIVGATDDDELDAPAEVIVRSWVGSALEYMQAADAFVHPSHADGMSNAVLEAMACGLPIIASAHGATQGFIKHDREALLVPARDPAALTAALGRLLDDASLRDRLSAAARESAQRYAIGRVVDLIEAEYRAMLGALSTQSRTLGPSTHAEEVSQGARFEFGANWREFAAVLDDDRIAQAQQSLKDALGVADLAGKRFLDAGSGSGLFSLAAARLGASAVHSFDFDPDSVSCTRELKGRYLPLAEHWQIEPGNVLDEGYVRALGTFDVVYSWGVLHHTGAMLHGMENVSHAVAEGGRLYLALYNDQGRRSRMWREIKRIYNRLPRPLQRPYVVAVTGPRIVASTLLDLAELRRRPQLGADSRRRRGMSYWHDLVDWVGGYPFEVASPGLVFDFYRERGFVLEGLVTPPGWGCNQYVFRRVAV